MILAELPLSRSESAIGHFHFEHMPAFLFVIPDHKVTRFVDAFDVVALALQSAHYFWFVLVALGVTSLIFGWQFDSPLLRRSQQRPT